MRVDDRLKTVITQPVADAHDRTVRWRQLVDLLSRPHEEIDPSLLDAALTMVRSGLRMVARPIRAATARSIAGRASEPRLIAIFAADKLEVAAPLLSSLELDQAGWDMVLGAASPEVAAFIRTIRGVDQPAEATPEIAAPKPDDESSHTISELVARIERLKSKREGQAAPIERFESAQQFVRTAKLVLEIALAAARDLGGLRRCLVDLGFMAGKRDSAHAGGCFVCREVVHGVGQAGTCEKREML